MMSIIAVPSSKNGGLNETVNKRFGKSENLTFITVENENIKAVKIIPIYVTEIIGNLGMHAANMIANNNASDVIIRYIGRKAFSSLNSKNINIFQAPDETLTVKQCVDLFIQGKLLKVKEPNAHLINK
ncbi:MAG: NifB/NifX family molybdenum-iron cluster-binding protein [Candidatus Hodarchaeota archaeon]